MTFQEVFSKDPSRFGSPDSPTGHGLVALAEAGRETWNAWRASYPAFRDPISNQWRRNTNLSTKNQEMRGYMPLKLDFSGFVFGDGAIFEGLQFSHIKTASFQGATFGVETTFLHCDFAGGVNFSDAKFGDRTSFRHIQVRQENPEMISTALARFDSAIFGERICFHAHFIWQLEESPANSVSFKKCQFGQLLHMVIDLTKPTTECAMDEAEFGDFADFSGSQLGASLTCFASKFGAEAKFKKTTIRTARFDRSEFGPGLDLTGTSFGDISFKDVIFKGRCDFSNREFEDRTNFGGAKFAEVPIFHECEFHQDTEFTCEESFPKKPAGTSEASRSYRTLKLAMNKHQATKEEQFFFRREMREERLVMWRSGDWRKQMRSVVYFFYEKLSNYGSSVLTPFLWLLSAWILAAMLFSTTSPSTTAWILGQNTLDIEQTLRWFIYGVANGVPLFGFAESMNEMGEALGTDTRTNWFALLLLLDKLLSLLFIFLMGLGLRNAFKMK